MSGDWQLIRNGSNKTTLAEKAMPLDTVAPSGLALDDSIDLFSQCVTSLIILLK
jgi:hypothetical protein